MKVGPNANFPVKVRHQSEEVFPETAHLYANVFAVSLNVTVDIMFVPDLSGSAPPWDVRTLPQDIDVITTVPQARMVSALLSTYVVTPNARYAGTEESFGALGDGVDEPSGVVFYVTPAEFDRYRADLDALSEVTSPTFTGEKVNDLREYKVVAFIERRILDSAWLRSQDAITLGRPISPAET
ncbi:hypothetical protein [Spirillospora sp. CA-294931]|uniref:hypothetical protein n=1 Tax=Spirillospora sp. CA-294931 TaxID=3240042 RepID=UPI003D89ECBF